MKKIIIPAVVLIITAGFTLFGQTAPVPESEEPVIDFTDESSIVFETEDTTLPEGESGDFFTTWDFVKIILILAAVILIIYAIFYGLKKAGGSRFQAEDLIRVIGSQSLTQNNSLHIVEVMGSFYLIGCGDGSVTHIADIEDKEAVDELKLRNPQPSAAGGNFMDFFNKVFGAGPGKQEDIGGKIRRNNKFMQDRIERLKKM